MQDTRHRILDALADGPVAGPVLADRFDISRAAIWKHIDALREEGFEIDAGNAGYTLVAVPEYGGAAIEFGLEAPFAIEFHEELESTNRRARDLASGNAEDVVVVAAKQTRGRGRLDREWASPPGGVYLSIILRPDVPPSHAPIYTLAAAVATARTARETGVDARIKWPNDVLVVDDSREPRKLAGILTEMEGEADRVSWIVVGIGVNVGVPTEQLVEGATSLAREGVKVARRSFVQRLLEAFHDLRSDPETVLPAWRELSLTLGREVRVDTPDGQVVGEALDVEFPGTLIVHGEDGTVRVTAGDCEHLRPRQ